MRGGPGRRWSGQGARRLEAGAVARSRGVGRAGAADRGRVGGDTVPRGRPGTTAIGEDEATRCQTVGRAGAADRGRGGGGAMPRGRGGRARPQPGEDEAAVYRAATDAATRGRREEAAREDRN
jgi:hypothetical protein